MAKILVGVTGSVAAMKSPELVRALHNAGQDVRVITTRPALYFFDRGDLPPGVLFTDDDEWPRLGSEQVWQRSDPVLHIEMRRWADLLLVAPLDANTLAKFASGISDNCLTCVWRAWDLTRPVILAPAMNTLMWQNPHTAIHLSQVVNIFTAQATPCECVPPSKDAGTIAAWINEHLKPRLSIAGPIEKMLACGDIGMGAMSEVGPLVDAVQDILHSSNKA
jgi:phosphopantothenoylcysteine decarboxylase